MSGTRFVLCRSQFSQRHLEIGTITKQNLWARLVRISFRLLARYIPRAKLSGYCGELLNVQMEIELLLPSGRRLNSHMPEHIEEEILENGTLSSTWGFPMERANKREKTATQSSKGKGNFEGWAAERRNTELQLKKLMIVLGRIPMDATQVQSTPKRAVFWVPADVSEPRFRVTFEQ